MRAKQACINHPRKTFNWIVSALNSFYSSEILNHQLRCDFAVEIVFI